MACFVYVLVAENARLTYVGWTLDLERRLTAHNAGTGAKTTRGRRWRLAYAEKLASRGAAMSREQHLKRDRKLRRALLD